MSRITSILAEDDPRHYTIGERSIIIPDMRPAKLISIRAEQRHGARPGVTIPVVNLAYLDRQQPLSEQMSLPAYLALRDKVRQPKQRRLPA
jgi:hypothetical protein